MSKKLNLVLLLVFFLLLIFTRFFNLAQTARFTQDESSDLVRMQQYIRERRLTLVGPISNDNSKVFGSLTYYMLIPFVVVGNATPVSAVYGAAFWGVVVAVTFVWIVLRLNKQLLPLVCVLLLVWYPLLETSRWAWNPHFVLVWIAFGILLYSYKRLLTYFLLGLCFGLAFHNHYIAVAATATFIALASLKEVLANKWRFAVVLWAGYIVAFVPFVLFDLRHPPGLFFSKYLLDDTPHVVSVTFLQFITHFGKNLASSFAYMVPTVLQWPAVLLSAALVFIERRNSSNWLWVLPVLAQVCVATYLDSYQTRYFLPAVPFFLMWLLVLRKGLSKVLATVLLWCLIIGSLSTVVTQLTKNSVPPDMHSLTEASKYIAQTTKDKELKNINVASLASSDSDPLANKYRDVLTTLDTPVLAPSQYDTSEHLFVVSTSEESTLREDKSTAMIVFKESQLEEVYDIPGSNWRVFWFHY